MCFKNSWIHKTETYTIDGWLRGDCPIKVEGGELPPAMKAVARTVLVVTLVHVGADLLLNFPADAFASDGKVSGAFDRKIWPLILDIGKPLAKTMIALGVYTCIRGNVEKGWKTVYRSGLGLVGLYLIDGVINILIGVGEDLKSP